MNHANTSHSDLPYRELSNPLKEIANLDERWVLAGLSVGQNDLVKILPTPDCYFSTPIICDGLLHQSLNQQRLLDGPILQGGNIDLL